MSSVSVLYSFSQQTGTVIYGVGALLFGVAYMMSDEYSPLKMVFAAAAILFRFVAVIYYFMAAQYKKDCLLSASGVCSASLCGLDYWSAVTLVHLKCSVVTVTLLLLYHVTVQH